MWKILISILTAGSVINNDIMFVTFFVTRLVDVKKQWFLLLAASIIAFLAQMLQISTKFTAQFLSNRFKKKELKTEFSNVENTD